MSKRQTTTQRSKLTDEDGASVEGHQQSLDQHELETILQSFNKEATKHDICRQIKTLQDTIEEETVSATNDQEETKVQKITLPLSGKVIHGRGNSLKLACELIEAWGKTAKQTIQTASEEQTEALQGEEQRRSQDSAVQKFQVNQQLPIFSHDEIYSRRFYQSSEELNVVILGSEWLGLEGLSRLVLLQALAQVDGESCADMEKNEIKFEMADQPPYSCILDGVQFVQINQTVIDTASNGFPNGQSVRSSVESGEGLKPKSNMLTLKFHYTRRMADILREEADRERRIQAEKEAIRHAEEEAHRQKYAIVEKIKGEMAAKEAATNLSLVDKYAIEAQAEFSMVSMKDLAASGNFSCPKKYLNQRDQPLEVPMDCIRKLCDLIDKDFDDRITVDELLQFIREKELPIEDHIVHEMFADAIRGRGAVNEAQRTLPLTHEEVSMQVKGRHAWNTQTKEWEIKYRPYRNYWIVLLLTVNPRIFAMPMPRVIPTKITAQYEQEEEYQRALEMGRSVLLNEMGSVGMPSQTFAGSSIGMNASLGKSGIDARYISIADIKDPTFKRDTTKQEGSIMPDRGSTIKIRAKKQKFTEPNPYETQIAARMAPANSSDLPDGKKATGFPKVTFAAQQVFNEVNSLSAKVPTWTMNSQNPINQFVPEAEQAYKTQSEDVVKAQTMREERNTKLSTLAGKERTLQLAGTMALGKRKMSPISKLRETRGMVTIKRVPDCTETKISLANSEQQLQARPEYVAPKDYEFKSYDTLAFGQKDFVKLSKPDTMENPHGLSAFDKKPKAIAEHAAKMEARRIEAETVAARDRWEWSHKLAPTYQPLSTKVPHLYMKGQKKEATQNLQQEKWESSYTLLARTVKDDLVVGKPKFNAMIKPVKAEDKKLGFSGHTESYQVLN